MKKFRLILVLGLLAAFARPAAAQISIDEVNAQQESVTFRDRLKSTSVDVDYFSLARYKAERAAIRKERNYLEIKTDLQGTLTSYNDPWISVSGGDNSIALLAVLYLKHTFKKNLFSLETVFNAKMGYNRMRVETTLDDGTTESNGVWFKNQDEHAGEELDLRIDLQVPQPVRERLRFAYRAGAPPPEEHLHDPGIP